MNDNTTTSSVIGITEKETSLNLLINMRKIISSQQHQLRLEGLETSQNDTALL